MELPLRQQEQSLKDRKAKADLEQAVDAEEDDREIRNPPRTSNGAFHLQLNQITRGRGVIARSAM